MVIDLCITILQSGLVHALKPDESVGTQHFRWYKLRRINQNYGYRSARQV